MDCGVDKINLGIDVISELLKGLGNPQDMLGVVHVAGTNGKGSVTAYMENILIGAGYRVGVYTSPAVFDVRENIRINGIRISDDRHKSLMAKIASVARDMALSPSVFETETALAFLYFLENECDAVLLETGMGGRLDATNVCRSVLCSVITSISMDHMQYLGDTLKEIAYCKAGIIKASCPVVLCTGGYDGKDYDTVNNVISGYAGELNAPVVRTSCPARPACPANVGWEEFDYESASGNIYKNIKMSMHGVYQPDNCATAIEAMEVLVGKGYHISDRNIRDGIKNTVWRGRFEKINDMPLTYMDGAHNPDAVLKLRKSIDIYFPGYKIIYIMGVLADKDYGRMADIMFDGNSEVVTVTPHNKRGLSGEILAQTITGRTGANAVYEEEYGRAVARAGNIYKKYTEKGDKSLIFIFGSLSYLGEIV